MKIQIPDFCRTPSVKGIYTVLFCFLFTSTLFSQDNKWEIGVGLRPLTFNEDPYSFIAKKFLSRNTALRFGASFIYKQKNDYTEYIHPYVEDSFRYGHYYMQTDKNLNATSFIGFQYGKKKNGFYWYFATDFSLRYTQKRTDIPVFNAGGYEGKGIKPGDFFTIASFSNEKIFGLSFNQNIGIQYFINSKISIAIEGGLFWERYYLRRFSYMWYATTELTTPPNTYGSVSGRLFYPLKELWQYNFKVSPLSFLTFIYQF